MQIDDRLLKPWGELYPCWPTLRLTKARLVLPSFECFTSQRNNQTIQKVTAYEYSSTPVYLHIQKYWVRKSAFNRFCLKKQEFCSDWHPYIFIIICNKRWWIKLIRNTASCKDINSCVMKTTTKSSSVWQLYQSERWMVSIEPWMFARSDFLAIHDAHRVPTYSVAQPARKRFIGG